MVSTRLNMAIFKDVNVIRETGDFHPVGDP